jgi:hypothetical protein
MNLKDIFGKGKEKDKKTVSLSAENFAILTDSGLEALVHVVGVDNPDSTLQRCWHKYIEGRVWSYVPEKTLDQIFIEMWENNQVPLTTQDVIEQYVNTNSEEYQQAVVWVKSEAARPGPLTTSNYTDEWSRTEGRDLSEEGARVGAIELLRKRLNRSRTGMTREQLDKKYPAGRVDDYLRTDPKYARIYNELAKPIRTTETPYTIAGLLNIIGESAVGKYGQIDLGKNPIDIMAKDFQIDPKTHRNHYWDTVYDIIKGRFVALLDFALKNGSNAETIEQLVKGKEESFFHDFYACMVDVAETVNRMRQYSELWDKKQK